MLVISAAILSLLPQVGYANEPHYANPTHYVVSGPDIYGNKAYQLTFSIKRKKGIGDLVGLKVKIYDEEATASERVLSEVTYVHLDDIDLTNDAGVFGSYFYGAIPFGPALKCRKVRRKQLTKYIYISNLNTTDGGQIEISVRNPCID